MPSPSRHVQLALYADDTTVVVSSHQQVLLLKYLQTYLNYLEWWLREWRIAINVSKSSAMLFVKAGRRIPKSRPVQLFGDPIRRVIPPIALGRTLIHDSPGWIISIGWESGTETGSACPVWRSAARSHIRNMQALQSKCFRIAASEPWYIANKQIHDYLGVPFFTGHIRSLTQRFDRMLADVGTP